MGGDVASFIARQLSLIDIVAVCELAWNACTGPCAITTGLFETGTPSNTFRYTFTLWEHGWLGMALWNALLFS